MELELEFCVCLICLLIFLELEEIVKGLKINLTLRILELYIILPSIILSCIFKATLLGVHCLILKQTSLFQLKQCNCPCVIKMSSNENIFLSILTKQIQFSFFQKANCVRNIRKMFLEANTLI